MRIKNLEYRKTPEGTPEIVLWYPNPHYGNEDKFIMSEDGNWYMYPDNPLCSVHKSAFQHPESCLTIALFRGDSEGYYLEFIGDRPIDERVNWQDFRTLIQVGYNELNKFE